jgi:hypothetical protein
MTDETQIDPRRRAIAIVGLAQVNLEGLRDELPEDQRKVVEKAIDALQRAGNKLHDLGGDEVL